MIQIIVVAVLSVIVTGILLMIATDLFSRATDSLFGSGIDFGGSDSLTANSAEAGHPAADANDASQSTYWESSQS